MPPRTLLRTLRPPGRARTTRARPPDRSPLERRRRLRRGPTTGTGYASRSCLRHAFTRFDVMMQVLSVERHGLREPVGQRHGRSPAGRPRELARVRVEAADVDGLLLARPCDVLHGAGAGAVDEE